MPEPEPVWRGSSVRPPPELGPVLEEFNPGMGNVVVGCILGALWILAGATLVVGMTWLLVVSNRPELINYLGLGAGLVMLVIGSCVLRFASGLRFRSIAVCERGLFFRAARMLESLPWDEIKAIVRDSPIRGRPSWWFVIRRKRGGGHQVNGNIVSEIRRFAKLLQEQAEKHQVPWIVER
jgi:hypothetical protein